MARPFALAAAFLFLSASMGAAAGPVHRGASALAHGRVPGNCPAWPQGSGILPDGDFSQAPDPGTGIIGVRKGTPFAPSWITTGPQTVDFYGSGNTVWSTPNAVCSVDLDGTPGPGGILHAPFATKMGARYTVSFLLSGNGACGPTVKTLKVSTSDQFAAFTWDISGGNDAQHGMFATESWTFTGSLSAMKLKFESKDQPKGNCGPVVAAIAVTAE